MKNLNTILPFYDATTEQYRYRDDILIERQQLRLVCSTKRLIPFIIRRATTGGTTATLSFRLVNAVSGSTLQSPVAATYLSVDVGAVYDYIMYTALVDFAVDLPLGTKLYAQVQDSSQTPTKTYYSEVLMVVPDVTDYIKVEFWDDELLNGVKANFKQHIYIDNSFKVPDYLREDEGEKVDGILMRQKMTLQKVLNLYDMITPEFVLDSIMALPMMDYVQVTNLLADCIVPLEVRLKDPEWIADTGGSFAKLNMQFVEWVTIKKGGYKEVACNCSSGNTAVINWGIDALTAGVPKSITYDNPFSSVSSYALSKMNAYDANGNPVTPLITAHTTTYFTVTVLEDATLEWTAIGE